MRADGFTLLEMLVALAVLSLGVLALVNLTGENTKSAGILEARFYAGIVADNRAVETLTASDAPPVGKTSGDEEAAGRKWQWTRNVRTTEDADILRVDIAVSEAGGTQILSAISMFRGRQ